MPRTTWGSREPDKTREDFDHTSMRASATMNRVHRDYAAHWFRWGFAQRMIDGTKRVLDVGCGRDCMLVRVLSGAPPGKQPKQYVGVDHDRLPKPPRRKWASYWEEFDATDPDVVEAMIEEESGEKFDLVTCFEVIEHMPKAKGEALLRCLRMAVAPKGAILLSTPCYDGKRMAANHIHEWRIDELAESIAAAKLRVERRFGTFMDAGEAMKAAGKLGCSLILKGLAEYYSWDVLANFLAPLAPDQSRNNAWLLRRK